MLLLMRKGGRWPDLTDGWQMYVNYVYSNMHAFWCPSNTIHCGPLKHDDAVGIGHPLYTQWWCYSWSKVLTGRVTTRAAM